ncbi:MAG: hypothetical protein WA939_19035 [Nodosilinea sp.]
MLDPGSPSRLNLVDLPLVVDLLWPASLGIGKLGPLPWCWRGFHLRYSTGKNDQGSAAFIQVFNWISRPQQEFYENGAAAIMVLLVLLVLMNSLAIALRSRFQQRSQKSLRRRSSRGYSRACKTRRALETPAQPGLARPKRSIYKRGRWGEAAKQDVFAERSQKKL